MNTNLSSLSTTYGADVVQQRNRVLRNTYWLLALSMVPTVLGAWLGLATGLNKHDERHGGARRFPGGLIWFHVCH